MIEVLLAIFAATLVGLLIVQAIAPGLDDFTRIGAALLTGCGFLALLLFFLSVAGVPWSQFVMAVVLLAALLVCWRSRSRLGSAATDRVRRFVWIDGVILLLIIGHAIFATWSRMYEWDWFGIWGLKARTFFDAGGLDWHFIRTGPTHPDYPLLVPLLVDIPSLLRGVWEDRFVGLMYTALSVGFLMIARGLLADEFESDWIGSAATMAIACPALNLWIGLGEGPVMAYGCAGLLLVRRGLKSSAPSVIELGAVLLGLGAWCKNEGMALMGMAIVALLVVSWRSLRRMWPGVAIAGIWVATRLLLHLQTDFMQGDMLGRIWFRLHDLPRFFRLLYVFAPDLRWFFVAAILTPIVFAARAWKHERFLTITLALQAFLLAVQALATRADMQAHIEFAWNRLPHQIAPALGFLALVLLIPEVLGARSAIPSSTRSAIGSA